MKSYRCTICGGVLLETRIPSECPFCAVKDINIMPLDEVIDDDFFFMKNISDESRKNLLQGLTIETTNSSFYKCAQNKSESIGMKALFERLSNLEKEHAEIIRKYLGLDSVDFIEQECSNVDDENIENAILTTKETINFYKEASVSSRESKISNLFKALAEAEEGVLKILKSFDIEVSSNGEEFIPPFLSRVSVKKLKK